MTRDLKGIKVSHSEIHETEFHSREQFNFHCYSPNPLSKKTAIKSCAMVKETAVEFLEGEELGTKNPKRCLCYIGWKDCTIRSHKMTWKKSEELRLIKSGFTLDV